MKNILEKNQIDAYLYRTLQNMVARVIKHAVMFHNLSNAERSLQAEIKIQVANSKFFIENNYQLYPVAKSHISTYIRNFFSYHLETVLIQFLKKQYYVDNLDALLEASDPNYTKRKKIDAILEDTKKRNSCIPEEMYKEKKLEKFLEQVSSMPQEEEKVKKAWTALMGSLNPIEAKNVIKKQNKEEVASNGLNSSTLATTANLMGGLIATFDDHSVFKLQKGLPANKYAVFYKGELKIWSTGFNGGTRAKIPSSFVALSRKSANSTKFISKMAGYGSRLGGYVGYYGAAHNIYNGNFNEAITDASGNYISIRIAAKTRNIYALAWAIGWEGGKTHGYILDKNIPGYLEYFKNPIRKTLGFEPVSLPK
ncbi:hypothetical protein [uncultured Maribacter sp.]|uniref:hypothetical protein n=1 Tax=uncultured Maribacter sp. TaxID=431308 RepID=UPI0026115290|nr:hypothetical protein [uncultured Maribacter sp.]